MGERLGPPRAAALFERLAIIGCGLIGSSLARIARRQNLAGVIVATDISETARAAIDSLGLADRVAASAGEAVVDADLVIVCAPVGAAAAIAAEIGPNLRPGAIVSDVGSVKAAVVTAMAAHLPDHAQFIPAHPVAGTEQSGPQAGFATLFAGRWCILTPPPDVDPAALEKLATFWTEAGSRVEIMEPQHHDLVLAITSHVPHLIAYNIVGTADDLQQVTQSEVIKFSAGGFRDFTRIAASDPTMWRDVFLNNKDAVLEILGRFTEDLTALQRMIRWGDGEGLYKLFDRTRAIRRSIVESGQETAAPNFGRDPTTD